MTTPRRAMAQSIPSFGRRAQTFALEAERTAPSAFGDDAKLFALTFLSGFLFVSVYLA